MISSSPSVTLGVASANVVSAEQEPTAHNECVRACVSERSKGQDRRWAEARSPARSAVSAKRSSITMNLCALSPSSSTARLDVTSSRPCRLQSTPAGASISSTPAPWSARSAPRSGRLREAGERPPVQAKRMQG
eukprot:6043390-Prymnesium_polylepis.1